MEGQHSSSLGERPLLSAEGWRMRRSQGEEGLARAALLTHSPAAAAAAALQGSATHRAGQQHHGHIPDFLGTCLLSLCMKLLLLTFFGPRFLAPVS